MDGLCSQEDPEAFNPAFSDDLMDRSDDMEYNTTMRQTEHHTKNSKFNYSSIIVPYLETKKVDERTIAEIFSTLLSIRSLTTAAQTQVVIVFKRM